MAEEPNLPATNQRPALIVVESIQPLFDTAEFEQMQRAAKALMYSSLLSQSVRGASHNECFSNLLVVFDYAKRWNIPAVMLAQCVSVVHDKLMIEGKAIAAALKATLGVTLDYHWTGERGTDGYRIYVSDRPFAEMSDEQLAALAPDKYPKGWRIIDGSVGDWKTTSKNNVTNPAWTGAATRNQLSYRGAREWARLYEPATMLGVYGDDEMDAYDAREPRQVSAINPATAQILTGFSAPKPAAADPVIDGEFTDATESLTDEAGGPSADAAADGRTDPATTPEPEQAQESVDKKPARRKAAAPVMPDGSDILAAAREDKADAVGAAYDAGYTIGKAGQMPNVPLRLSDDERTAWLEGHKDGQDNRPAADAVADGERSGLALDAFEDGHAAGLDNQAGDVPRAWAEFADDWTEGWHAGAAERIQDQVDNGEDADTDDGADDDEAPTVDAFDAYSGGIRELATWKAVKDSLGALAATDVWKTALAEPGQPRVVAARISAGLRLVELQNKGVEPLDVATTDLTAFRCWMETTDDPDLVLQQWQVLVMSPACQELKAERRAALESAVKGRVERLRGGKTA